jgi:mannose-6-phosphate isomerase-like protein (cupin superfamily)
MEVEHHNFVLRAGQGVEIAPGQQHQAINRGKLPMRMVVTSQPPSHGDRVPA